MRTDELMRRLDSLLYDLLDREKWHSADTVVAALNALHQVQLDEIRRLGT